MQSHGIVPSLPPIAERSTGPARSTFLGLGARANGGGERILATLAQSFVWAGIGLGGEETGRAFEAGRNSGAVGENSGEDCGEGVGDDACAMYLGE